MAATRLVQRSFFWLFSPALSLTFSLPAFSADLNSPIGQPSCEFDVQQDRWICVRDHIGLKLDWVPRALLSAEQKATLLPGCHGAYIDPYADESAEGVSMESLPLIVEANHTEVTGGTYARLSGDVRVSQGPRSIAAEEMTYDRSLDEAGLDGEVSIRQPGMLIRGEHASVSTVEQQGRFTEARFVMHDMHMRGSAGAIEQDGPDRVTLRNGAITSCEPGGKAWALEGEELIVNRETGQGYGRNVKLKLGGVPVFYLPYITFPVGDERRSGFLFPSISSSDDGGLDIAVPYYFNLAPNYDLTLTPRIITGRGAMLETEFRHLNRFFETQFNAAYLNDDDGGNDQDIEDAIDSGVSEDELRPHKGSDRWLVQLDQDGGGATGWYTNIDYTQVSDEDYFRDLGTSSFSVANTTYLNQSIEAGTLLEHWNLNVRAQDYQTLLLNVDEPYRKMPQAVANGLYNLQGLRLSLYNQVTRFDHSEAMRLDGSPILTGERVYTDYRLQRAFKDQGAYAIPEIGYKSLFYKLHPGEGDTVNANDISLGAAQASLDLGLVFEHPGGRFLQTLEPRAYYLYRQYTSHDELYDATASGQSVNFDTSTRTFTYGQLYRDSRFSGSDRLDDANQITVGLTNRWFSQTDGHELFNISLGQINHFQDRRIGLESELNPDDLANASEWAVEFAANWRNGSGLYGSLIYDDAAQQTNRFATGYNYASKNQLALFSIGYSFVRANPELSSSEQLDQLDTAFVAPVSPQWYLMGRVNYDFENEQELETFFGFEYNDCCYRFRILGRRWLDSNIANITDDRQARMDSGVFFEIHLKGLGGSGAKVNSILEDAIPGYRRREEALNEH